MLPITAEINILAIDSLFAYEVFTTRIFIIPVALVIAIVLTTGDIVSLLVSAVAVAVSLAARSVVTASRVWPEADSAGD